MGQPISALAAAHGVTTDTIRYYERRGLLPVAERTAAGYRLFGEDAFERLGFIRGAQRMGLRLADVKELLDVADRGQCPCGHTRSLVQYRLAELDAEIARLKTVRRHLIELKRENDACFDDGTEEWSCAVGIQRGGKR
jgi:DNA-binding transcriptional MerR regulator